MTARQLKRLIDRELRLEAELREVRRKITTGGREYARERTGCLWLRPEAIRALVEQDLRETACCFSVTAVLRAHAAKGEG